ncbi:MAG: integration host factor subunit beta [Deltaproteobacteria bacterium]|nr:integration host factor subunit beta [Deltaproteobacteria bacterium]
MNKAGIVSELRIEASEKGVELSEEHAKIIVDLFFNSIADALLAKERIEIRGLWSFYTKKYGSYKGRNPKTGERISVKPKWLPFFKCGKELRERVDAIRKK